MSGTHRDRSLLPVAPSSRLSGDSCRESAVAEKPSRLAFRTDVPSLRSFQDRGSSHPITSSIASGSTYPTGPFATPSCLQSTSERTSATGVEGREVGEWGRRGLRVS